MPPGDAILADLLTSPDEAEPFLTRVKKVVVAHAPGNANLVDDALGGTAWGEIRWYRSLGWPIAPRMADGFSVRFLRIEPKDGGVGANGVAINESELVQAATPLLWDGPHDEESFRVSFLFHGLQGWYHQALVDLKPEIDWEGINPWWLPQARRLRNPESLGDLGVFKQPLVGPVFLDEFVVVNGWY